MEQVKVGIIGATGYAGVELVRLLLQHPQAKLAAISSVSFEGQELEEVYPNFTEIFEDVLVDEDTVIERSDVIFTAVSAGICEPFAAKAVARGKKVIDLGADFRLSEEDYNEWYHLEYHHPELHEHSCYCIPELHRSRVTPEISVIGNPGCYVTSAVLALAPIIRAGYAKLDSIVIDSKSGVTGAGRKLTQSSHFPDCNEAFAPYKIASHRHTPEIEQSLSELAGEKVTLTFVPHLLPVNRGIVSTSYVTLKDGVTEEAVETLYREAYANEKFVRVLKKGGIATIKNIKYSNYCDISLHFDPRTHRLIVVSALDNMVKGAAGQAIQNMNLLYGLPETTGLLLVPPAF